MKNKIYSQNRYKNISSECYALVTKPKYPSYDVFRAHFCAIHSSIH